nr:hypothetical protein [Frigidibacter mobilis]
MGDGVILGRLQQLPVIGHIRRGQAGGLRHVQIGPARQVAAKRGIDQRLPAEVPGQGRGVTLAQRNPRRKRGAGTVAHGHHMLARAQKRAQHREGIVACPGPQMFGRQTVIDRHQPRAGAFGNLGADGVVAGERAQHEAAAMHVEDPGHRVLHRWRVMANRNPGQIGILPDQPRGHGPVKGGAEGVIPFALAGDGCIRGIHRE